jgi:hypothetical protein
VTHTNRTKGLILVSLLVLGVALTSSTIVLSALADNQGTASDPQTPPREPPWMSQLTDTQKQEIQQLTDSLRQSGATPQEIRDAVDAKLQAWGIELPIGKGEQRQAPWMSELTDEQKTEMKQLLYSLNETGATPQQTRDAVNAKLEEWGIQLPERPTNSTQQPPWMNQLTDDQKTQIQQLAQSMKDSGATQQEVRDAVNAKLQEWGIQVPQDNGGQPRQPPWMSQLTDEQKTQIQQLMASMKQSGATPQEIRDAVNAKLQEWGIQVPAPPQGSGQ